MHNRTPTRLVAETLWQKGMRHLLKTCLTDYPTIRAPAVASAHADAIVPGAASTCS